MAMQRLAIALLLAAASWGQNNPFGRITGRVTDTHGAVVPGAAVKVTNIDTNVAVTTATNDEGNYEALNLIPGIYRLTVTHSGFKLYARAKIEVHVGDTLDIPAFLELGPVNETVTVTSETAML